MSKIFSGMQLYAILMHDLSNLLDSAGFSISNVVGCKEHHRAFIFLSLFTIVGFFQIHKMNEINPWESVYMLNTCARDARVLHVTGCTSCKVSRQIGRMHVSV